MSKTIKSHGQNFSTKNAWYVGQSYFWSFWVIALFGQSTWPLTSWQCQIFDLRHFWRQIQILKFGSPICQVGQHFWMSILSIISITQNNSFYIIVIITNRCTYTASIVLIGNRESPQHATKICVKMLLFFFSKNLKLHNFCAWTPSTYS